MARIRHDNSVSSGVISRSLGIDEHTALLLDIVSGDVLAVGQGTAYVCSSDHDAEMCLDGFPLTFNCELLFSLYVILCVF
jgi:cyanophycinase-like exopeptidase